MTESTRRQKMERIAQAMFEHGSVQKAAAALGLSEVTVWRWTQKPEFQKAYSEVRREALSRSGSRLLHGSNAAAATLLKLMVNEGTPAAVRARTAESVIQHAEKTYELEDVGLRLKRLEEGSQPEMKKTRIRGRRGEDHET